MRIELSPEMIQALLVLCDGVPLRGPESKVLVAGAQAALLEALRESQGSDARPAAAAVGASGRSSGGAE